MVGNKAENYVPTEVVLPPSDALYFRCTRM